MAVFDQDGVLVMGNKTPVTILHETLIRKGVTANYELIYTSPNTNDPIFKYQVTALGFTAIGSGKTKKEAKHDAAAGLLRRMHDIGPDMVSVEVQPTENIASPYTGALKENYIGMLEEICMTNKIPMPEFNSISEIGPPHARIFTVVCKISYCTETAVARTKKQAKHLAAQQMIRRVEDILGDRFLPVKEKVVDYDNPEEPSILKEIENGTFRHDMSIPMSQMHNIFDLKKDEFRVPEEFFKLINEPVKLQGGYTELENPKKYLEELVNKLEGICKIFVPDSGPRIDSPIENYESNYESKDSEEILFYTCMGPLDPSVNTEITVKHIEHDSTSFIEDLDQGGFIYYHVSKPKPLPPLDCNRLFLPTGETLDKFGPDDERVMLYLTVICPQGEFVFLAIEPDLKKAERVAAIKALVFLRSMTWSINPNKVVPTSLQV